MVMRLILRPSLFHLLLCAAFLTSPAMAAVKRFSIPSNPIELSRAVRPGIYFDAVGKRAGILGVEAGRFESWVFPIKLFHDCRFTVSVQGGDADLDLAAYAQRIIARPESVTIIYSHPQFTIRQTIFSPVDEPGSFILFDVDAAKPLTLMTSFVPDLKPMWPGGLGGQSAGWNQGEKFFVISESRRKFNGLIGSPLAVSGSSTPAHMLGAGSVRFEINIDPEMARRELIPIVITGNMDGRAKCIEQYKTLLANVEPLYRQTTEYYRKLREERTSVTTPDRLYNQSFEWAKAAMDKGMVANPDLGAGLIAGWGLSTGSARPGFGWFFGGDAFINSYAINGYGDFETMRQVFRFLQKYQRQKDGKITHEISQSAGMIRWFDDYPYAYYHADTTPLYIVAFHEYLLQSGDTGFLKESWESLKKAYAYCLSADTNDDGLMENTVAGLGASELGSLQENLLTDILLGSATVKAMQGMTHMAQLAGDARVQQEAQSRYERGLLTIRNNFFHALSGRYAFALTTRGLNPELTSWASVPLAFRLLEAERAEMTLQSLASHELSTDWGTRMLANTSKAYDPIAYNNGGVWLFLTGFVAMGEYEYRHAISGYHHVMQAARSAHVDALGFSSEIWSGDYYRPLDTSVPHQLFSTGMIVSPFVRGLMGLRGDEIRKQLTLAPQLPAAWDAVDVKRFRVGNELFSVSLRRATSVYRAVIEKASDSPYEVRFSPSFGHFAKIQSVLVDGRSVPVRIEESSQDVSVLVNARINRRLEVEIRYTPGIEIDVPFQEAEIGQRTSALKVVSVERGTNGARLAVEGLGGRDYNIRVQSAARTLQVTGAKLGAGTEPWRHLEISFADSPAGVYAKKTVTITPAN